MKTRYGHYAFCALAALCLCLLSACGSLGGGKPSTITAASLLKNSIKAMKQLKSEHVDMTTSMVLNTGSASTKTMTINEKGSGDQILPDQISLHLTLTQAMMGQNIDFSEVVTGKKVYIQSPKGVWYMLDLPNLKGSAGNPFSGADISSYNKLFFTLAQDATVKDHGNEMLNGQSLRHITIALGNNVLKDLLDTTGQLKNLPVQQQQEMDRVLKNIKLDNAVLDLWIDEGTSYLHRMALKFTMSMNLSSMMTPTASQSTVPSSITNNMNITIDYSKFNIPVTIKAPANAQPTNNLLDILR